MYPHKYPSCLIEVLKFQKPWFREFPIQNSELSTSQIEFCFCFFIYCCCFRIVGFGIRKDHVVSYRNKSMKFIYIRKNKVSGGKPKFHTQITDKCQHRYQLNDF